MNHLELADLLIVRLVASPPVSPPLFPLVLGRKTREASHKEDFLEMMWFSFV